MVSKKGRARGIGEGYPVSRGRATFQLTTTITVLTRESRFPQVYRSTSVQGHSAICVPRHLFILVLGFDVSLFSLDDSELMADVSGWGASGLSTWL